MMNSSLENRLSRLETQKTRNSQIHEMSDDQLFILAGIPDWKELSYREQTEALKRVISGE